jgi:hypothetical protein
MSGMTSKIHADFHGKDRGGASIFRTCHVHYFIRHYLKGNVEKSRQRRSRPFAVLSYSMYAPRVKMAAALLDGLF